MKAAFAGGLVGLGSPLAGCARSRAGELAVTELADGVVMVSGAGGNVVAARGPGGVVMVDGGTAEWAEDLGRAVGDALGQRRAAALFNTHWHYEQTGSNARFGAADVPIIAHENTRLWLTTDITRPWEERTFTPPPESARPTQTFYDRGEMALGDGTIAYGYLPQAHTDGDIYVHFPEANVLAAGGVVTSDRWPLVDWWTGGWIGGATARLNANPYPVYGGLVGGLQDLVEISDADTRIVPADGPVISRAELEAQLAMYRQIADRLRDMLFAGLGPAEAVAEQPTAGMKEVWGDPSMFVTLAFQSLWGHYTPDA